MLEHTNQHRFRKRHWNLENSSAVVEFSLRTVYRQLPDGVTKGWFSTLYADEIQPPNGFHGKMKNVDNDATSFSPKNSKRICIHFVFFNCSEIQIFPEWPAPPSWKSTIGDNSVCDCFRTEPQIFKSKFKGWDDVIPVDFTRTSESVLRRGVDLKVNKLEYDHWMYFRLWLDEVPTRTVGKLIPCVLGMTLNSSLVNGSMC